MARRSLFKNRVSFYISIENQDKDHGKHFGSDLSLNWNWFLYCWKSKSITRNSIIESKTFHDTFISVNLTYFYFIINRCFRKIVNICQFCFQPSLVDSDRKISKIRSIDLGDFIFWILVANFGDIFRIILTFRHKLNLTVALPIFRIRFALLSAS